MSLPATAAELARLIDHTLLDPRATTEAIRFLCRDARERGMFSVCVHPCRVAAAKQNLRGSPVAVCTVIGFPLGANTPASKGAEARDAIGAGADELDMVINLGLLFEHNYAAVEADIAEVVHAAEGRVVKVILETAHLDAEQIRKACEIAVAAGAKFVKTSTGFGPGGATVEAVRIMREAVGPSLGVKASGGIRDAAAARAMLEAGANRIGASASLKILDGWD